MADNTDDDGKAQAGYAAAVSLWVYEGELIWSKFNAMLVANSIVLGVIALAFGAGTVSCIIRIGLPLGGVTLCALWFFLTKRGFDQYTYWILSARELEEKHLSPIVKTVSRGAEFASASEVKFELTGRAGTLKLSPIGKTITAARASYLVIFVIAAMYILLAFRS
jgi:hypothetical protein